MAAERPIRVLVVDDHELVRRGLRDLLDAEPDLEVVAAAGGGEAALQELERLEAHQGGPDVVLMDLEMQPLDGIEATRLIRGRRADLPVVALSSFAEEHRVRAALDAGVAGYILKESDADAVSAAVRAAHRGQLQMDPAIVRPLLSSQPAPQPDAVAMQLTEREREILRLVAAGRSNKEIARSLVISERTARSHVSHILSKLGVASRTQAALWAIHNGFADQP
jgi:DNA-binding NarL/FixJ family response regulator